MYNLVDLKDKRILITGASSGIGRATAILLSRLEAKVILVARNEEKLKAVQAELEGEGHSYYCFDLHNVEAIEDFTKTICVRNDVVDGLVYSAGMIAKRPLRYMEPAHIAEVMNVNTIAFIELVRCITLKRKNMSIVGISSRSAIRGAKGRVDYCASKGAMDAAVRAMAMELAVKGIRVNTIDPGIIATERLETVLNGTDESANMQVLVDRQFLGVGKPEDVANLAAFLLSDAAGLITGASILVDGGLDIT